MDSIHTIRRTCKNVRCNNILPFLFLLIFIFSSTSGLCSKIVRPWRSTTAIVKAGESFEVWFDADDGQIVDSILLQGPYNVVGCSKSIITGDWEYDPLSGNRYDTRITVTLPPDSPADRYDLILKTSKGDVVSYGGVKVVHEYKDDYYIMHMSDGHLYQYNYDQLLLMARKTAMIDIANIMDCQIIIETGDNMYNVRNHPEREVAYFLGIESEGIKGMTDANAATFLVPGDHEGYSGNDYTKSTVQVNSDFFNDYWGLQNSNFKYGNGRFIMLNNAWDVSTTSAKDHAYQIAQAAEWLTSEGAGGNFFVTAGHCYNKIHEFIDDNAPLDLVLAGDKHHIRTDNPYPFNDGSEEVAYIAGSIRDHFEFNLFSVNNIEGTFRPVPGVNSVAEVLFSGHQDSVSTWVPNLTLTFTEENNGSVFENTATIVNRFNFPIQGAKVRFVLPLGFNYEFTNATLEQEFDGDQFHIVDLITDVEASSTIEIYIRADDLCPDDPDKTDPGLCGCNIPEGTCESLPLTVNNGSGDGSYQPYEVATITADPSDEGMYFYCWEVISGNPDIADTAANTTTLTLGYESATITATYREIPKVNMSAFISQEVSELIPGGTMTVSITMKNTGTKTWTRQTGHKLGSRGLDNNDIWGLSRVELAEGEEIKPNEEKSFVFDIQVPSDSGLYVFQWQMIQEDLEWFGDKSTFKSLRIGEEGEYLDDCDQLTAWQSSTSLALNNSENLQGTGCIEFSGSGTDEYRKIFSTPYFANGSVQNSVLQFWYYVSDASKMGSNQVEIGSSGKPDNDECSWSLSGLSTGWNFIQLNTADANITGTPNLNAVNWFRLYNHKSGNVTTRIDGIQLIGDGLQDYYALTVNNGSGSGSYKDHEKVMILANSAPEGQVFDKWVVESGNPLITNLYANLSYVTIQSENVTISATYKENISAIHTHEEGTITKVFPNPADKEIYVELNIAEQSLVSIELLNIIGQKSAFVGDRIELSPGKNTVKIQVDHLNAGLYLLKLNINDAVLTKRILVK